MGSCSGALAMWAFMTFVETLALALTGESEKLELKGTTRRMQLDAAKTVNAVRQTNVQRLMRAIEQEQGHE